MFTDKQAGSYWITRLDAGGTVQVPWDLEITDESSGVARSHPRFRLTQIGYDLT